jgi:prepilin-type N-terminal cleavage/methylation domain-containing protein
MKCHSRNVGKPNLSQGFSLVEVLVSLLIVSTALAAIIPVLTVVAYRRALSQRIETANQLARSEVDRIRTLVDLELFDKNRLRLLTTGTLADQTARRNALLDQLPNVSGAFPDFPPPTALPDPALIQDNIEQDNSSAGFSARVRTVGNLADRDDFFLVQTSRDQGSPCIDPIQQVAIPNIPCSFRISVRVYHRLSFNQDGTARRDPLETRVISAIREYSGPDAFLFPMAGSTVRLDAAADLAGVCRNLDLPGGTACDGFPTPRPPAP